MPPTPLGELHLRQLKRHFDVEGTNELKHRLSICTDAQTGESFEGNFRAAAIAFLAYGAHNDGHTSTFGHPHDLSMALRGHVRDYNVEEVEEFIEFMKNLLFDVVRAKFIPFRAFSFTWDC